MSSDSLLDEDAADGTGQLTDPEISQLEDLADRDPEDLSDEEITSKIKLSVKRRFDFPTWLLVFEFQNRDQRRADCLGFNTRAGRNFPLVGFEFKASRSDWLAEKRDHEKADLFVQQCDEWYVVAGRTGIVKEEELPDGWGLLEVKPSGQLWKLVESDLGDMQSTDLDRRFFARFMKKAVGAESNFTYSDIREAKRRGYEEAKEKTVDDHLDYEQERIRNKIQAYEDLEEAGLRLSQHEKPREEQIERLKAAEKVVKAVKQDRFGSFISEVQSLERTAENSLEEIIEMCDGMTDLVENLRDDLDGDIDAE